MTMMHFKTQFVLVIALSCAASLPIEQANVKAGEEKVAKGKSLVLMEPVYSDHDEFLPDYHEPMMNYRDDAAFVDEYGNRDVIVYPSPNDDLAVAESNIVFRPLFAYRKQMAQRKRVYKQPTAPAPAPRRTSPERRYVFRYPVFRRNPNYVNRPYDYVS